jgi:hypothetical protein
VPRLPKRAAKSKAVARTTNSAPSVKRRYRRKTPPVDWVARAKLAREYTDFKSPRRKKFTRNEKARLRRIYKELRFVAAREDFAFVRASKRRLKQLTGKKTAKGIFLPKKKGERIELKRNYWVSRSKHETRYILKISKTELARILSHEAITESVLKKELSRRFRGIMRHVEKMKNLGLEVFVSAELDHIGRPTRKFSEWTDLEDYISGLVADKSVITGIIITIAREA